MASIESDDDDFLASQQAEALPSLRKSLKRLKKRAAGKSEAHESLRSAASSPKHGFNRNTDPSFNSNPNPSPNAGLAEFQSTGPLRSLCTTIGPDNAALHDYSLHDLNVEVEADSGEEDDPGLTWNAEQEEHEDLDPTLDGEQRSDKGGSEEDSESDEEVDEDDEIAVLNLLEKRRKSTNYSPDAATAVTSPQTATASAEGHEATEKQIGKRKIKSAELEEMHATSQRLLRETLHASFKPQVSTGKSISSVLEKIRLRKLQLAQGSEYRSMPFFQQVGAVTSEGRDEELFPSKDILPHAEYALEVEDICTQEDEGLETVQSAVHKNVEEDVDVVNTPERYADGGSSDVMASAILFKCGNTLRPPMEDTQDLLSHSQSSHEDLDEDNSLGTEEDDMHCASRVDLHFDTETQDNFEHWPDEDSNKENLVPSPTERTVPVQVARGPSIRALIDDEAEDEDEDVLLPGDDEEADEGEDVKDLVIEEDNEKARDIEKRAELHRKWLEQQDAVMTDDILLRLKTGWRPRENRKRGLEFLDEEVDMFTKQDMGVLKQVDNTQLEAGLQGFSELPDENSQDMEASRDEDCPDDEHRAFKALDDIDDMHESSDDEETEKRMMRQRFLQESEEQGDLMSPADDETSREVFVLINKVNIATSNKKLKPGFVDSRYLGGGTSNSNSSFTSKSSFLRRTASSTLSSVQRQGASSGSGTRSFIFGRDDSNSSHSVDQQVQVEMEIKENLEPSSQGLRKESSDTRQVGKARSNPETTKASSSRLGLSLFEILRRQSTDLGHSLQKNFDEASHNISPIFAAFKPIKSTTSRTPRGA